MRVRTLSCTSVSLASPSCRRAGLPAQGQSERPQFRTGVELLQLDVAVLDSKRQPVSGLTAADFTVLDNGVEDADSRLHAHRAGAAARERGRLGRRRLPPTSSPIK